MNEKHYNSMRWQQRKETQQHYNAAIFYEAGKGGTIPDVKKACGYHARAALKGSHSRPSAPLHGVWRVCITRYQ